MSVFRVFENSIRGIHSPAMTTAMATQSNTSRAHNKINETKIWFIAITCHFFMFIFAFLRSLQIDKNNLKFFFVIFPSRFFLSASPSISLCSWLLNVHLINDIFAIHETHREAYIHSFLFFEKLLSSESMIKMLFYWHFRWQIKFEIIKITSHSHSDGESERLKQQKQKKKFSAGCCIASDSYRRQICYQPSEWRTTANTSQAFLITGDFFFRILQLLSMRIENFSRSLSIESNSKRTN